MSAKQIIFNPLSQLNCPKSANLLHKTAKSAKLFSIISEAFTDRRRETVDRRRERVDGETRNRIQETGDGNRRQVTGDRKWETVDSRKGDRRQET